MRICPTAKRGDCKSKGCCHVSPHEELPGCNSSTDCCESCIEDDGGLMAELKTRNAELEHELAILRGKLTEMVDREK